MLLAIICAKCQRRSDGLFRGLPPRYERALNTPPIASAAPTPLARAASGGGAITKVSPLGDRMATPPAAPARTKEDSPPPPAGDFYKIAELLDPKERAVVKRVRDFMETEVAPIIEDYWGRDQFPHEIIPKLRALDVNIAGVGYRGYGSAGGRWLLNGFIAMEMA